MQANLSLRERLRRDFSLTLPELEDEDSPETYIERCHMLLRYQPTWSIRRYVTLGFFQFGKLLMYLDLDPSRWSASMPITEHLLVKQVLGGDVPDTSTESVDPDIDRIPLEAPEVQLIEQADSSQHAAIIEATRGRSFVIEGPPGTGKSQTITNIIGVALAQGKSVLFVSEKLAALEVVRTRLEAAGLDQFCLELHSHKTRKGKFIEDVKKRLEAQTVAPSEKNVNQQLKYYQHVRDAIAEYLRLVNQNAPGYEGSYRDLFCEAAWLREKATASRIDLDSSQLAPSPRPRLVGLARTGCAATVHARTTIRTEFGDIDKHPWYGLTMLNSGADTSNARSALAHWVVVLDELTTRAIELNAIEGMPAFEGYGELWRVAEFADQLGSAMYDQFNVSDAVQSPAALEPLRKLVEWEVKLRTAYDTTDEHWKLDQTSPQIIWAEIAPIVQQLKLDTVDLCEHSIRDIALILSSLDRLNAQIDSIAGSIGKIAKLLGCALTPDIAGLRLAQDALDLIAKRPRDALHYRSAVLETVKDTDVLQSLAAGRADILAKQAKLSIQFDLLSNLDIKQLEAVRSVLAETRLLSFLSSEWRSANDLYQSLRHKKTLFRLARNKVADIVRLIAFNSKLHEFGRNHQYASLLGAEFRGIETPAEEILEICTWNCAIKESLGTNPDTRGTAAKQLMRLDEKALDELDLLFRSPLQNSIAYAIDALSELHTIEPDLIAFLFRGGWSEIANTCSLLVGAIGEAAKTLFARLRDSQAEDALMQSLMLIETTARMLQAPSRIELHKKFLNTDDKEVWDPHRIEYGKRLIEVLEALKDEPYGSSARHCLAMIDGKNAIQSQLRQILAAYKACEAARSDVEKLFVINESKFLNGRIVDANWRELTQRVNECQINEPQANQVREIALAIDVMSRDERGFEQLRSIAFSRDTPDEVLAIAGRCLVLGRMALDAIAAEPKLRDFSADKHEELFVAFKEADDELKKISRARIATVVSKSRPPQGGAGSRVGDLTEMHLLRHELGKQKRHLPIRKVVRRAGAALQALKPCFMMGPLSVAQYLAPGGISFDIAVMDEASQMRPEDALGTIARCKQVIVVGDPKQLPPTSFFDRLSDDTDTDEDEELTFGAQESILDIATPLYAPARTLIWHYRSHHESLIAFSNYSFYEKKLLLFPTAHASAEHLGLRYRRVKGVYANHTNEIEAQELVREVVREIRSGRERSVGIAAVNIQQAQAIRDEWDRVTRELPDLQELLYQEENGLKSLFIKNLENVQGDERDVIFISLTYGRDRNGNFYQRFGPINRDDGWRRLNVLFTRSKEQMVVFSSMDSAMITPTGTSKRGVTALKDFLSFCETGTVPEATTVTGRGPDSPFEEDVAAVVRQFGLEAEYQVGVAGFFIDIGVLDPAVPRHYLLGIECDGASYHTSQSVRDRDKIRQEVLENLGWRIHRIWSTDWFKRGARERQRLRDVLDQARLEADERRSVTVRAQAKAATEPSSDRANDLDDEILQEDANCLENDERGDDEELRNRLLKLRATLDEEFPDSRPENCLLSDDIVQILVKKTPITMNEFHHSIPLERRQQIDMEQSRVYLSTILAMIEDHL